MVSVSHRDACYLQHSSWHITRFLVQCATHAVRQTREHLQSQRCHMSYQASNNIGPSFLSSLAAEKIVVNCKLGLLHSFSCKYVGQPFLRQNTNVKDRVLFHHFTVEKRYCNQCGALFRWDITVNEQVGSFQSFRAWNIKPEETVESVSSYSTLGAKVWDFLHGW